MKSNWKTYKLSEIINLIGGGTPKTTVLEYWNGNIPWLSVVDFGNCNKYIYQTEKSITEKGLKESSTKILNTGQIIISARGTVGALAMLGKDMAFNQSCYGIYANEKTTDGFLYYLLKDNISKIKKNTHGAVFDTITKQTFENIKVSIPEDKAEQTQIAKILSSLDDKIELLQQMNQTLEDMAQAIFKEWFVDFNFPGFDGELVDGLPKGWRMGKVKDVYKTTSGGTPSRAKGEYYENGTINWVKSKELNGNFIFDTEEKITEKAVKNSSAKLIPKHSILLAMYGATVGEYAITGRETTCNQAICAVIEKEFPYTYFFEYFKTNRNSIIGRASGSAQQNISQALIQQLEILIPSIEIVNNYHLVVEPLFNKMEENLLQIQTLTQTRDTLLPKLMSGNLEIN